MISVSVSMNTDSGISKGSASCRAVLGSKCCIQSYATYPIAPPVNVGTSGILIYWYTDNSFWREVIGSPVISSFGPVLMTLNGSAKPSNYVFWRRANQILTRTDEAVSCNIFTGNH